MDIDVTGIRTLEELELLANACSMCALSQNRKNVVFGSGPLTADVLVVGEGPGQKEDELGVPFVGRSGQLLDELMDEIDLAREDVYIANVVKCRTPKNRDPFQEEIDACKGYLIRQIELIDPLVVLTLGNFSMKLLLDIREGITAVRGKSYEWNGRILVPTFHPAAALRGGDQVADDIRKDLAVVRNIINGNLQ